MKRLLGIIATLLLVFTVFMSIDRKEYLITLICLPGLIGSIGLIYLGVSEEV